MMIFTGKPPAEQNYQIKQEVERTVVIICEDCKCRYRMQKTAFQRKTPCYLFQNNCTVDTLFNHAGACVKKTPTRHKKSRRTG